MKCRNLKVFFILSVVLFFSFSARLSAEWCYSDEQKAELDRTFEQFETERRAQNKKLIEQGKLYEVAEISIEIFRQEISDIKDSSKKAEQSWQAERITLILESGGIGIAIGIVVGAILNAISDYLKAQQTTIFN